MKNRKPKKLEFGDMIAITAPAMYNFSDEQTTCGIKTLENMGFRIILGESVNKRFRNTTGTAEFRIQELESFFLDDEVKAIICLCGGDSAYELIASINYSIIQEHPKIFTGMSDITHLHLAFYSLAGLTGYYGMDLIWGFGVKDSKEKAYNVDLFKKCCMISKPIGRLPNFSEWEVWRHGSATGQLVGGWISAIFSLRDTKYYPNFPKCIWFAEFYGIEPHQVRQNLVIMAASGFFDNVRGVIIGKIIDCEEKEYQGEMESIKEIIVEITEKYGIPIIANVDFGHGDTNMPLFQGMNATINTSDKSIEILESYVSDS